MAYNFNQNQNGSAANYNPNQQVAMPFQNQNVQPLFPQPQGNVYNINSTLEVANVPTGAGMSVALCLNEGFMYIKTMQNGNPMFWAYRIMPYDGAATPAVNEKNHETAQKPVDGATEKILEQFKVYNSKFAKLENQVSTIENTLGQLKEGEWKL